MPPIDWYTASEGEASTPVGAGRRYQATGLRHAMKPGTADNTAVCGAADLVEWVDVLFDPLKLDQICDECLAAYKADIPEVEVSDNPFFEHRRR